MDRVHSRLPRYTHLVTHLYSPRQRIHVCRGEYNSTLRLKPFLFEDSNEVQRVTQHMWMLPNIRLQLAIEGLRCWSSHVINCRRDGSGIVQYLLPIQQLPPIQ